MTITNNPAKPAKISESRIRPPLHLFPGDLHAIQISQLTGFTKNTINHYLNEIPIHLPQICNYQSPSLGEIEIDEFYVGVRRIKGQRGHSARNKTIVFGIFKHNGKVYIEIVPDCKGKTLQEVIRGRISLDKVIHSDGWRGYHGLVERGYKKHFRVNHLENQSSNSLSHINCIESFWSYVKTCLMNCSDMNPATFYLYLKETELRFKHRNKNMYNLMRKISKLKSLF